jgi:hypothetical protein
VADTTAGVAGLVLGESTLPTTVAAARVTAATVGVATLGAVAGDVTDLAAL